MIWGKIRNKSYFLCPSLSIISKFKEEIKRGFWFSNRGS